MHTLIHAGTGLLCLICSSLFAGTPTKPLLKNPANHATKIALYEIIRWKASTDPDSDALLYDLYLGEDSSPALFGENLDGSWISNDGNAFVIISPLDDGTGNISDYVELIPIKEDFFKPETTYYWRVVAKDADGNETSSEIFSFTTGRINQVPTPPDMLSPAKDAINVSKNVTLTWKASTDADGDPVTYNVYFGANIQPGETPPLLAEKITTNSYTFSTNLSDQEKYYWQIKAVDGYNDEMVWGGDVWSFTVENYLNNAPTSPVLISPVNGAVNTGSAVTLTWQASTDRDGDAVVYDVYVDKNANPTTLIASGISHPSYVATFNGTDRWYWKVVARDVHETASTSSAVYSFIPWRTAYSNDIEMIAVEGGTFTMGQNGSVANEAPAHNVTVSNFEISKYPITYAQYVKFLNAVKENIVIRNSVKGHRRLSFPYRDAYLVNKGIEYQLVQVFDDTETGRPVGYEAYFDSPLLWNGSSFTVDPAFENLPVKFTYYDGALFFAEWCGYSLPSEAEWEYAAMGGKYTHNYKYSGSNAYKDVAADTTVIDGNFVPTRPVGTKLPNELGIYDMTSYTGELCLDYYDVYKETLPAVNPVTPSYTLLFYNHTRRGNGRVKQRQAPGGQYTLGFRVVKRSVPIFIIMGQALKDGNSSTQGMPMKGFPLPVMCDLAGNYFCAVPAGWSGTITPVWAGYTITPQNISVSSLQGNLRVNIDLNYAGAYFVSGKVLTSSGQPLANVKITDDYEESVTQADGSYSIKITKNTSSRIYATLQGYTFNPAYIDITNIKSDVTGQNFTASTAGTDTISGTVRDSQGNPVQGITLTGLPTTTITDATGKYTAVVTTGWSGTITPVSGSYTFTPVSISITNVQQDLTGKDFTAAYTGGYTISGKVTDLNNNPIKDVTVSNGSTNSLTDAAGHYSLVVAAGWSGAVTAAASNYNFTPSSLTFTAVQADLTDQNFIASVITGIDEQERRVLIYPNPSTGNATIALPASTHARSVKVYTATGVVVLERVVAPERESVEVTIPGTGIYLLRVIDTDSVYTEKLLIR